MARGTNITKAYENFNALDLRSSDLLRSPDNASAATNARRVGTNTLTSRNGYQTLTDSLRFAGLYTYKKYDPNLGYTVEEIIGVADGLYRLREYTISMAYAGPPGGGGGGPGGGGTTSGGLFGGSYWSGMFGGGYF